MAAPLSTVGLASILIALSVTIASAEGVDPTHFACVFDEGYTWSYDGGKFTAAPPSSLSFEIGSIDLDKQSASLILDGKPAATLRVVRAINANHFIEVAGEGFLNLTTIYDLDPVAKFYPAVHSRHFGILGQPIFAQYAGHCTGKQ